MEQLQTDSIVVRGETHLSTTLDNETVLLDTETGVYYGMNEVGTKVWDHIQSPTSVAELQTAIADEYDISEEDVATDVERFLVDLVEADLVEIHTTTDES